MRNHRYMPCVDVREDSLIVDVDKFQVFEIYDVIRVFEDQGRVVQGQEAKQGDYVVMCFILNFMQVMTPVQLSEQFVPIGVRLGAEGRYLKCAAE